MRILYDRQTNTAYLQLSDESEKSRTHACDPLGVQGEINLDFGSNGELIGIEVFDAKRLLPGDLLMQAEKKRISQRLAPPEVAPPA
ncbi:MAG: DUF2283 domain-containing protein [Planctomycetes bacterium]|nr:DUF2283 domain-containing protein [Planctomycetota bacterium]